MLDIKPITDLKNDSRVVKIKEEKLKGKVQVKLLRNKTIDSLENSINDFLKEKGDKILVKDIKFVVSSDDVFKNAMVIYEMK